MKKCGIYLIRNTVNNKRLIGSSIDIHKRWNAYRTTLNRGVYQNPHLQASWNKYGREVFKFVVLEECSRNNLLIREDFWMEYYRSRDLKYGYNLKTAERQIPSVETRRKMSLAKIGHIPWNKGKTNIYSKETLKKISDAGRNRKVSDDTRKKMSKALMNRPVSLETRRKLSLSNRGRSHPSMLGFRHSDETKRKISIANEGRCFSEEHRKKLSDSHKGQVVSELTRRKLSELRRGHSLSEESKLKISIANKGRQCFLGHKHSEETKRRISESEKRTKRQIKFEDF